MTNKLIPFTSGITRMLFIAIWLIININSASGQISKPSFSGGPKAYNKFIKKNLVLPNHIKNGDAEGEVTVSINVSSKGEILSAKIEQSLDSLCDTEALRVVNKMPKLKAARKEGENTASKKILTFYFRNYEPAKFVSKGISLHKYIEDNLVKPKETETNEKGSKVVVELFITKEGNVGNATIVKGLSPACDEEAIRFAKNMTGWKPAKRDAQDIDSHYKLDIPFEGIKVMPEFPGGQELMMKFISSNIRYPSDAQRMGIEGRVVIRFVVDKDGQIQDAEVMKSIHDSIDEEALRVINRMPNWKPGTIGGKPTSVYFTMPIRFRNPKKSHNAGPTSNNNFRKSQVNRF